MPQKSLPAPPHTGIPANGQGTTSTCRFAGAAKAFSSVSVISDALTMTQKKSKQSLAFLIWCHLYLGSWEQRSVCGFEILVGMCSDRAAPASHVIDYKRIPNF